MKYVQNVVQGWIKIMSNLKELEKKYEELGEEIERLKREERKDGVCTDCIFLLSTEEYEKYKDKIPDINCWWWLRSPTYRFGRAATVNCDGSVSDYGDYVGYNNGAVRPALRCIPGQEWKVADSRIFRCGMTWIKIDENLYIAEVPITFRRFDGDSNNYQTSEIRQFLLNWCEERASW
jgi:hypothetical protein